MTVVMIRKLITAVNAFLRQTFLLTLFLKDNAAKQAVYGKNSMIIALAISLRIDVLCK